MKKIIGLSLVSILLFTFCSGNTKEAIKVTKEEYSIINIDPPKHFYVDLKRESDSLIFSNVYVSKHCNNWRNLSVGQIVKVRRYTYLNGGRITEDFDSSELRETLCR